MTYNLKKYLKFVTKNVKSKANALAFLFLNKKLPLKTILIVVNRFEYRKINVIKNQKAVEKGSKKMFLYFFNELISFKIEYNGYCKK